jgi:hypothetical protein
MKAHHIRQDMMTWSARLGKLAADASLAPPETTRQLGLAATAGTPPNRLSAILGHLARRRQRQDDTAANLRAQEFIMGA